LFVVFIFLPTYQILSMQISFDMDFGDLPTPLAKLPVEETSSSSEALS
jgi:hypothetical protein